MVHISLLLSVSDLARSSSTAAAEYHTTRPTWFTVVTNSLLSKIQKQENLDYWILIQWINGDVMALGTEGPGFRLRRFH
ncbi:unnamed protein product, partial [Heterobilharzia americana]